MKAQEFAHRLVEFADLEACCKFFRAKAVDFDHPNATGWSILMSVCACGRADLVGLVADATTNVSCATVPNRTTVLHLAAMSANPLVMEELTVTPERQKKLQAIVDAPNINGDTPLMMACVAKNVSAVRVLLTTLNANVSYGNANGMNALMCAARLNDGVTPEARDELMAASDEIVRLLLLHLHVQVNAAEVTAGNTALHFAVLSQNAKAVERLTESAVQVDVTIKNKVGMTAIEVGKRARVSTAIMDLLQRRFAEMNAEAAERSLAVQKELIASSLASTEVEKKAESSKKKKPKKKAPSNHHTKPTEARMYETKIDQEIALSLGEDEHEAPAAPTQPTADVVPIEAQDDEDAQSEWQPATKKKNRRKLSIPEDRSRTTTQPKSRQPQKKQVSRKTVLTEPPAVLRVQPIATQMPRTSIQSMNAAIQKQPEVSSSSESKRPEIDKVGKIAAVAEAENHMDVESSSLSSSDEQQGRSGPSSSMSYHKLNAIFHRTFPMADELDIAVESFVIASSATDAELQPADGLSISQVEVLQEAHLRAYHYLNEKKMELTRVLEAQRLEAQFALQKEILHLN
uniref:Uncharacterized protein n=1 Tax=Globisporangium ultimum (strain ATCC 200006 / CBS 805.95 / DAOM BR144) TaxID=431595 RepID=K3WTN1_GLOUD